MIKKSYHYFVVISLLFLFTQCEQFSEVEVDIPFEGERVVVYGTISNDGNVRTEVWLTNDFNTSQGFAKLEGVVASITNQAGEAFPLTFDENIGYAELPIIENDSYMLSGNYLDFSIASTSTTLPSTETEILENRVEYSMDSMDIVIKINFRDNDGEINYSNYSIGKIENGVLLEEKNSDFSADIDCNGQVCELIMEETRRIPVFNGIEFVRVASADQILIKINSFSEEINDFNTSLINNGGEIGNQLTEPNTLVSNIQNGYGYFGGIKVDSILIDL